MSETGAAMVQAVGEDSVVREGGNVWVIKGRGEREQREVEVEVDETGDADDEHHDEEDPHQSRRQDVAWGALLTAFAVYSQCNVWWQGLVLSLTIVLLVLFSYVVGAADGANL